MPQYLYAFKDDATTTLATGIVAASTSLQVVSGGGALFPAISAQQAFIATLIKNGNPAIKEVVLVTGRSGDNMTGLVRNYGGTGALTWNAGDTFALLQPAEAMSQFVQFINLQSQFTNYANDSGNASAYRVNLTPVPNASIVGMPIRFMAAHDNNANCTFSDGITTASLIVPGIGGVPANAMRAGGIYVATFDGTTFQLGSAQRFDMILGQVGNSQVPVGAVVQWESSLVLAFSQLTGTILQSQIPANLNLPGSPTTTTQGVGNSGLWLANTAFVNPSSVLGSYRKQPDGNIDQWGLCNPNGGAISVTFPVAFPSVCDGVVFGQISSGPTQVYTPPGTVSRTGFQVANTGGQTYWRARGH